MTSDNGSEGAVINQVRAIDESPRVNFDLATGVATISQRAPFAIALTVITMPLVDFLDYAAQLTLEITKQQRAAAARMHAAAQLNGTPKQ